MPEPMTLLVLIIMALGIGLALAAAQPTRSFQNDRMRRHEASVEFHAKWFADPATPAKVRDYQATRRRRTEPWPDRRVDIQQLAA